MAEIGQIPETPPGVPTGFGLAASGGMLPNDCGLTVFQHACQLGCEGIVSKRLGLRHRSGRRISQVQEPAGTSGAARGGRGLGQMAQGKNRIMIYGPNDDGTYVVEFRIAGGEAFTISIPQSGARVIRHFQERMPHGLFVPEMKVLDDDMDIESVKTKLHQARSSLDEMRACKRRAFGDNEAKFGKALSGFLGAGRSCRVPP